MPETLTTERAESPAAVKAQGRSRLTRRFTALQYPNYRLWFAGQVVSLVGTWMQFTAQGYLIFQLTQSPAYLGLVGFANGLPTWLLTLYGGVIADRVPRRTLLVITQTSSMLLAFILAGLAFAGLVQPWHIVVLALCLGTVNAFDTPTRQSFVAELVGREDLTNAIALNATMFNTGAAVGPAVAGVTYALVGPAWCFTLNGISFLAVIAALLRMRLQPFSPRVRTTSTLQDLKEGVRFAFSSPVIRTLLLLIGSASLFGAGYMTLIPAWAVDVLGGDSTTLGLLQSARGLGGLGGALMLASLGRYRSKGKVLSLGTWVFPVCVLLFAFLRWLPLSLAVLVGAGWGFMVLINNVNGLVQTHTPDRLRGRVMSVYTLIFFGLMPVGALLAGALAERLDLTAAVAAGASASLVFAAALWLKAPEIRALE